jgi:hypothetical protein
MRAQKVMDEDTPDRYIVDAIHISGLYSEQDSIPSCFVKS